MIEAANNSATLQGWVALLFSAGTLIVSLWNRASVAELHTTITTEQTQRCAECRTNEFPGRGEFVQLETRVSRLESRRA